jgi:hypothetical protein
MPLAINYGLDPNHSPLLAIDDCGFTNLTQSGAPTGVAGALLGNFSLHASGSGSNASDWGSKIQSALYNSTLILGALVGPQSPDTTITYLSVPIAQSHAEEPTVHMSSAQDHGGPMVDWNTLYKFLTEMTEPKNVWKDWPSGFRGGAARQTTSSDTSGMRVDEFLNEVYRLDFAGQTQSATFVVFDRVERLLHGGSFGECDEILTHVNVDMLSSSLVRSFLTITFAAKDRLPYRSELFLKARSRLTTLRGEAVATKLLAHLN